jgi:4-aminobutyrate aminotransferase-like enzyme
MVGVEITAKNGESKGITSSIQRACLEKNLLLLTCGTYGNVIRWIPPLVVNTQQIDEALIIFQDALESV